MPFFSGSGSVDDDESDNLGIDWVVHYVFDGVGMSPLPALSRAEV